MSDGARYVWPATLDPMPRAAVLAYYNMGLRYRQLWEPKCWDCGEETGPIERPVLLLYRPFCAACHDKRVQRRLDRLADDLAALRRACDRSAAGIRSECLKLLRDPEQPDDIRALARETITMMG